MLLFNKKPPSGVGAGVGDLTSSGISGDGIGVGVSGKDGSGVVVSVGVIVTGAGVGVGTHEPNNANTTKRTIPTNGTIHHLVMASPLIC